MSAPTVTMSMSQYDEMKKQISVLSAQVDDLQTKLADSRLSSDTSGRYAGLVEAIRKMLDVIGFAVANLSPEIIRRWPYEQLRVFARSLKYLPDGDENPHLKEFSFEMEKFATECEMWENRRRETPDRYIPPPNEIEPPTLAELQAVPSPQS